MVQPQSAPCPTLQGSRKEGHDGAGLECTLPRSAPSRDLGESRSLKSILYPRKPARLIQALRCGFNILFSQTSNWSCFIVALTTWKVAGRGDARTVTQTTVLFCCSGK